MNDCMSVLLVIFEYISQLQIVQFAKSHGLTMGAIGTFASITYGLYTDRPNLKIEFIPDSPVSCVTKENYDSKTILSASAYMRVSNIGKRTTTVKAVKLVVLTKKTTFIRCIVNLILRCCCMIELSKFRYLKILNPKIVLGDWQYEIGEGVKKYPKLIQRSEETFMNNDLVIVSGGSITGVSYFEEYIDIPASVWLSHSRQSSEGKVLISFKIIISDINNKEYESDRFEIEISTPAAAKKINSKFGESLKAESKSV